MPDKENFLDTHMSQSHCLYKLRKKDDILPFHLRRLERNWKDTHALRLSTFKVNLWRLELKLCVFSSIYFWTFYWYLRNLWFLVEYFYIEWHIFIERIYNLTQNQIVIQTCELYLLFNLLLIPKQCIIYGWISALKTSFSTWEYQITKKT